MGFKGKSKSVRSVNERKREKKKDKKKKKDRKKNEREKERANWGRFREGIKKKKKRERNLACA